ncbi:MAG: HAMP domain-containing histidine kinase [Deltaproteobacteria bacterium]|nr:HAMP domain-containing histidine kinase [Deltaproteobacteria bacterium]
MAQKPGLREAELIGRLNWYVNIRWLALFALAAAAFVSSRFVDIPVYAVATAILVIAAYNAAFILHLRKIKGPGIVAIDLPRRAAQSVVAQAAIDLLVLLMLMHYLGGAENPFIFYFIFHTVLTGLLLDKKTAYAQAVATVLTVGLLILAEYLGVIPHRHLRGFTDVELYSNGLYLAAVYSVVASVVLFTAYITATIMEKLGERETELEEKSVELERANSSLVEKDRLKSEYVRMVAHDVMSPLASILSLLAAITEGYSGAVPDKTKELLKRAQSKTEFLHGYASDLLNLSTMRSKKTLKLARVDLKAITDEAIAIAEPEKGGKDLMIKTAIEGNLPAIDGDSAELLHVFINLVGNAVRYTPVGGSVTLIGHAEDDSVTIEVSDTGIGIPAGEIDKVFDEFFRGSNAEKETRGTGLGLTLAKYIVERHGGAITVRSEEGKGTTFSVKLPLRNPPRNPMKNA